MGLFTNRKKKDREPPLLDDSEMVDPGAALGVHGDLWDLGAEPADDGDAPRRRREDVEANGAASDEGVGAETAADAVAETAVVETTMDDTVASEMAPIENDLAAADRDTPPIPPPPKRRRADRPTPTPTGVDVFAARMREHGPDVTIDTADLCEILEVSPDASFAEISEAKRRFMAEHDPSRAEDAETAEIVVAVRRAVNRAFAVYRLDQIG